MGLAEEALDCFRLTRTITVTWVPSPLVQMLGDVRTGKEIYKRICRPDQDLNSFMSNCLVSLHAKYGLINSARIVFDAISEPNLVSWTSLRLLSV